MSTLRLLAKCQPTLPGLEPPDPMHAYRARVEADIFVVGAIATLAKRWRLNEAEEAWAASQTDTRRPGIYEPGDAVVFTGEWLRTCNCLRDIATVFTIQECSCKLCALGRHVCVTQWLAEYGVFRHVNKAVIRHKGALHIDELAPSALPIVIPRCGNTRPR